MVSELLIQVISGGTAGMVSATVTCPLDVVKTRLQSSKVDQSGQVGRKPIDLNFCKNELNFINKNLHSSRSASLSTCYRSLSRNSSVRPTFNVLSQFKQIVASEGATALWKGLIPTLMGIVPSRAIYFSAYNEAKKKFELVFKPGSTPVHIFSAASSGFITTTIANPIWMIRTRMQLDHGAGEQRMNIRKCIEQVYTEYGLRGFLKGVTASYAGLCETVLHFGVYEKLKALYLSNYSLNANQSAHYPIMMVCGGTARLIATCISYPHEVVRTRLREKATLYNGFFQTLFQIYRQESWRGLYSGISVHLMKTVPNSAVLMATYELTLALLKNEIA